MTTVLCILRWALRSSLHLFFVPWRTRFICVWIVPIVLPTASDARCGLSRILSAIVIFFSEVCLNFLLSPPDPSDQREMEGGEEILFFEQMLPFFTAPPHPQALDVSVTMLVLGAVPGAPPTINLYPCWELDFLLQLFDFYVIACFQSMKELLPLTSR